MESKKLIGIILVGLGAIIIIIGAIGLLGANINFFGADAAGWMAVIPFIVGIIFFSSGIGLMKSSGSGGSESGG